MIAYCYNEEGIYTGQEEAQESPLQPGIFLLPAQSTFSQVPEFDSLINRAKWDGETWIIEEIPLLEEQVIEDIVIDAEEQAALKQSILQKLRAIGLTDEELYMIFGEN